MPIALTCAACGTRTDVSNDLAGRKILCRGCDAPGRVPSPGGPRRGYRCPFCRTREKPVWKPYRGGLAGLVELALVILAGPSLLGGLCFLAVAVGSAPLVVCLAVLAVALFAGALWAVDRMFTSWRQVCPGCKTRVS